MRILVTGTAGFIGFHLANRLLAEGDEVVGLDNINDYYDTRIKYGRLAESGIAQEQIEYGKRVESTIFSNYSFFKCNLQDQQSIEELFEAQEFDAVCHLAAQAGVRYSLENPRAYTESNISGFLNILEACRHHHVNHLVYASSSSVYGLNTQMPFSTAHNVDHPVSLYAASKKSNELMAHSYSHLYNIPTTGLRFFTVYGPWGRPDMALFLFTKAIIEGKTIDVYNFGNMERDFTYIDDIVEGLVRIIRKPATAAPDWKTRQPVANRSSAPYRIYNIGNNNSVKLTDFIAEIENALNKKAKKNMLPMQPGDVEKTWADVNDLVLNFGYSPQTSVRYGIKQFIDWYKKFYKIEN